MSLLAVIPEPGGPRQACKRWSRYSCSPAIAILLAAMLNILGMRTSSWVSPELAAHIDDNAHIDYHSQGGVALAGSWSIDDDNDNDGSDDDDAMPRSELPFSLPPLSAVAHCTAALASRYQSLVFEPSTPPPRA